MAGEAVRLGSVRLTFGEDLTVLDGIDLTVAEGEIVALIGPSGCGKSTILNLVAGALRPSAGEVSCFGEPVRGLNRTVSYMTQRDTLLPWRNALDNAALPLELAGMPKKERYERTRAELARLGVGDFGAFRPHQLSGGMRSRLSLARALLAEARIFLMDEPFAAIDALLRLRLQQLLVDVWNETHRTILYVTHDLNEAISLAHRIVVLSHRPARTLAIREVDFPHPRDVARIRTTEQAQRLYRELWGILEGELQG